MIRFPKLDFGHRESLRRRVVENEPGNVLGRGVHVHDKHRLPLLAKVGQDRIILVKQHPMVESPIDPALYDLFDSGEIHHHAQRVEFGGSDRNDGPAIVAVEVPALTVVVQEPVAVTEADFASDLVHDKIIRGELCSADKRREDEHYDRSNRHLTIRGEEPLMPLLDHFHAPVSPPHSWESFHAVWSVTIVERLNRSVLPEPYFAETQVHIGSRVEIDVATFDQAEVDAAKNGGGGLATLAPPRTTLSMPAVFPDEIEIQVFRASGGNQLVGAIELISPGNKDRPETRRAFAAKCASLLQAGIGLVIVDIVTERQANLHDSLVELLQAGAGFRFHPPAFLYSVAYHPVRRTSGDFIDLTLVPLAIGQQLPTMLLPLRGGPVVPVELEATYSEARLRSRL